MVLRQPREGSQLCPITWLNYPTQVPIPVLQNMSLGRDPSLLELSKMFPEDSGSNSGHTNLVLENRNLQRQAPGTRLQHRSLGPSVQSRELDGSHGLQDKPALDLVFPVLGTQPKACSLPLRHILGLEHGFKQTA